MWESLLPSAKDAQGLSSTQGMSGCGSGWALGGSVLQSTAQWVQLGHFDLYHGHDLLFLLLREIHDLLTA